MGNHGEKDLSGPRPKDFWAIGSKNTALLVIDMQLSFVDPKSPLYVPESIELVPGINLLSAACRKVKIPVIFIKNNCRADLSDTGLKVDMLPIVPGSVDEEMTPREGKKGNELFSGLVIEKDDYVVNKILYSALISGSSSLEPLLRGLGKDTLLVCGVCTDVCVGTTIMDGMMLGFKAILVTDLTKTFTEERHNAALVVYDEHFAKLMKLDEVIHEINSLVV